LSISCPYTGSKFIFRGLDDRKKLKSVKDISVCWIEEAEGSHEDYKELKDRMRIKNVSPHMFVTYNPVSKNHGTYNEFFFDREYNELKQDEEEFYRLKTISRDGIYYHHSTYVDNAFLNETWIKNLLSEKNELLRSIKALGRFGTLGKKIFTNIELLKHDDVMKKIQESKGAYYRGLDFGFAVSYNALVEMVADREKKELYIFKEYYTRGKKNSEIMKDIEYLKGFGNVIIADSAEPKTIKEFNDAGFRLVGATKGQGSVKTGIKKLQEFDKIYISDDCQNVWREMDTLEHPKNEQTSEVDEDKFNIDPHTVDALRYALEKFRPFSYDLKNFRVTGY
jgi:phage terminase large subunit